MRTETRPARPSDMDWLMGQISKFDQFAGFKRSFLEDKDHAGKVLATLIGEHVFIVCENVRSVGPSDYPEFREPLGFIAGMIAGHPFNPKLRVLTELLWWIAPEHRKTRAGFLLLNEFTQIGRRSCDWVVFTLEHHSPVSAKHLLKRGFVEKERSFVMEV